MLFQYFREIGFFLLELKGSKEGDILLASVREAVDMNKKLYLINQKELAIFDTALNVIAEMLVLKEGRHVLGLS